LKTTTENHFEIKDESGKVVATKKYSELTPKRNILFLLYP
jgi:hypothetical protein